MKNKKKEKRAKQFAKEAAKLNRKRGFDTPSYKKHMGFLSGGRTHVPFP
jgi:hypothetical protein